MNSPLLPQIDIDISCPLWDPYIHIIKDNAEHIASLCLKSEHALGFPYLPPITRQNYYLSICLLDDAQMQQINQTWRQKNTSTNILSFPALSTAEDIPPSGPIPLGDMVFAFETIEKEAKQAEIIFMQHMQRLIIHGLFHLLGYDHMEDSAFDEMKKRETEILHILGIKKIFDFELPPSKLSS